MKWVVITIFVTIFGASWHLLSPSENVELTQSNTNRKEERTDRSPESVSTTSSSIFIPYWNIPSSSDNLSDYDTLIYFGVAPDSSGTMILDSGLNNIGLFVNQTKMRHTSSLLTVRMLDDDVSLDILEDISRQTSVIRQSVELANEYGFDGIVLDLELGVIPFEDSKDKITSFVEIFSEAVQNEDLTLSMTIYGDVFYLARPYDMAALARHIDHIYIMAYDFHKRRGEPGPNFPLVQFKEMIVDFTDIISPKDITVVFGMYGYDWTLGKQGLPLKAAKAIPLNEIENGYSDCRISVIPDLIRNPEKVTGSPIGVGDDKCVISIDTTSKGKKIRYVDQEGYDHILWYEDKESVEVKIDYLMEQGIGSVGYWVWGYF